MSAPSLKDAGEEVADAGHVAELVAAVANAGAGFGGRWSDEKADGGGDDGEADDGDGADGDGDRESDGKALRIGWRK